MPYALRLRIIGLTIPLALGVLLAPSAAGAQQPGRTPRIAFLCAMSGPSAHTREFQHGLRELGYVEGKTILVEYRFADGRPDRFRDFAAEMVRLKVDAIVLASTLAVRPAQEATRTIPIVVAQSDDPVRSGFVASLGRPGGTSPG